MALAQESPIIPDSILQSDGTQTLNRVDDTLNPLQSAFPPRLIASTFSQLHPEPVTRGLREIQIFAKTAPAVVFIEAKTSDGSIIFGSGSLIGQDGLILTNRHVTEGVTQVEVVFKSEMADVEARRKSIHVARVLATDEMRDLALIKVDRVPPEAHPIVVGDSSTLQVGADVHAIGHPEGAQWTYTRGFVSQIRPGFEWLGHKADVIQTQTPIAPGSSGGPLLDNDGKLVGVNSFLNKAEGFLNYAVASNEVTAFMNESRQTKVSGGSPPQSECETKVISDGFDSRFPQYTRIIRYDRNCDGKADADILIPKNQKSPIYMLVDSRFTGYIDEVILDIDRDSKWDISYYDTNGDGHFNLIGYHDDGSLNASRYEEVKPPLAYAQITSR